MIFHLHAAFFLSSSIDIAWRWDKYNRRIQVNYNVSQIRVLSKFQRVFIYKFNIYV